MQEQINATFQNYTKWPKRVPFYRSPNFRHTDFRLNEIYTFSSLIRVMFKNIDRYLRFDAFLNGNIINAEFS